jgi:hypothetical protein
MSSRVLPLHEKFISLQIPNRHPTRSTPQAKPTPSRGCVRGSHMICFANTTANRQRGGDIHTNPNAESTQRTRTQSLHRSIPMIEQQAMSEKGDRGVRKQAHIQESFMPLDNPIRTIHLLVHTERHMAIANTSPITPQQLILHALQPGATLQVRRQVPLCRSVPEFETPNELVLLCLAWKFTDSSASIYSASKTAKCACWKTLGVTLVSLAYKRSPLPRHKSSLTL